MKTNSTALNDKGYRFPPAIISHVVWLSLRFSLSFRDGEVMMAERGVIGTYETIRQWCLKCGQTYANALKKNVAASWETNGIWMRSFSKSTGRLTTAGEP
jgi:transposase-like protein